MAARQAARKALGLGATQHLAATTGHAKPTLFFREICRTLPWVIQTYKLEELTTLSDLRHNINQMFRQYSEVKSPEAVDLLIYKGREELEMIIMQHKQRHHLIDKYVGLPATTEPQAPRADVSPFLANFYLSN
ncbi:hypothetical protein QBZ16_000149 [Prototheca wickerhamii]|uniref:NADH dehydrogenase [ubiquinone] 1 alpha subcomplex subunit 6 n=1 Tax=Prototheca wickerhamii TaxID=3111 RepID=A0AAD9MP43_PROWI|nr:hypothetical protein QBZ16_000149 [Prototheca wickerhamii]